MPFFFSAGARRTLLWVTSAAGVGALLADGYRFEHDGPDNSLVWGRLVPPRWSVAHNDEFHARRVYARFFGEPPQAVAEAEEMDWGPWKYCPFRDDDDDHGIPQDLRSRFMRYATVDPQTGQWVLKLHDFVRCLLLLTPAEDASRPFRGPPFMRRRQEQEALEKKRDGATESAVVNATPAHVERRLKVIFDTVDLDRSGTIDYAEFVVFFTMLSTRRRTFEAAFELLDDDDNRVVNEHEFTRLLNTLMVDPSVQVVYDSAAELASPARAVEAGEQSPSTVAQTAKSGPLTTSAPTTPSNGSRLNTCGYRGGPGNGAQLSHTIPSSQIMRLVRSPIPHHHEPPPGSTHRSRKKTPYIEQLETQLAADNQRGYISYDTLWYRMDFLRWELRAVEFGTFDTANTGFITLRDFRAILSYEARHRLAKKVERAASDALTTGASQPVIGRDVTTEAAVVTAAPNVDERAPRRSFWNFGRYYATREEYNQKHRGQREITPRLREDALDAAIGYIDEDAPTISWQFYQTVFDVIRESDRTLPALRVALRSLPPTPSADLVAGAIPDGETRQRSADVKDLIVQKAEATSPSAKEAISNAQAELVRPTAFTWRQFGRVLEAIDGIPKLTEQDQRLFFALFDADRSGTITPDEFAQLCELKRSFFALSLPRFTEPRRNPIQQFVFCMQQLE